MSAYQYIPELPADLVDAFLKTFTRRLYITKRTPYLCSCALHADHRLNPSEAQIIRNYVEEYLEGNGFLLGGDLFKDLEYWSTKHREPIVQNARNIILNHMLMGLPITPKEVLFRMMQETQSGEIFEFLLDILESYVWVREYSFRRQSNISCR